MDHSITGLALAVILVCAAYAPSAKEINCGRYQYWNPTLGSGICHGCGDICFVRKGNCFSNHKPRNIKCLEKCAEYFYDKVWLEGQCSSSRECNYSTPSPSAFESPVPEASEGSRDCHSYLFGSLLAFLLLPGAFLMLCCCCYDRLKNGVDKLMKLCKCLSWKGARDDAGGNYELIAPPFVAPSPRVAPFARVAPSPPIAHSETVDLGTTTHVENGHTATGSGSRQKAPPPTAVLSPPKPHAQGRSSYTQTGETEAGPSSFPYSELGYAPYVGARTTNDDAAMQSGLLNAPGSMLMRNDEPVNIRRDIHTSGSSRVFDEERFEQARRLLRHLGIPENDELLSRAKAFFISDNTTQEYDNPDDAGFVSVGQVSVGYPPAGDQDDSWKEGAVNGGPGYQETAGDHPRTSGKSDSLKPGVEEVMASRPPPALSNESLDESGADSDTPVKQTGAGPS